MKKILSFLVFLSVFLFSHHPLCIEGYCFEYVSDDYICNIINKDILNITNITSLDNTLNSEFSHVDDSDLQENLYWLSRVVSAESKGECNEGQIAVANVILNRVASEQFPNEIKDVIFQPNQFSTVSNGMIYETPSDQAVESARVALEGKKVIGDNVLYFYNSRYTSKNNWIRTREIHTQIGNHIFAY